jgi:hypothetical protein
MSRILDVSLFPRRMIDIFVDMVNFTGYKMIEGERPGLMMRSRYEDVRWQMFVADFASTDVFSCYC